MGSVATLCNYGLILSNGTVSFYGNIDTAIDIYIAKGNIDSTYIGKSIKKDIYIKKISIENNCGTNVSIIGYKDEVNIKFDITINIIIENATLSFTVLDSKLNAIFTAHKLIYLDIKTYIATIPAQFLLPGTYYLRTVLHTPNQFFIDQCENDICFNIEDTGSEFSTYKNNSDLGVVNANIKWQ